MLESDLLTFLASKTTITSLVSSRIYPNKAPLGVTYPCVTYFKVSATRIRDMDGASGMVHSRIQINAWDNTPTTGYSSVKAIADAIRKEVDNYTGAMGSTTVDAVQLLEEADLLDKKLATDVVVPYGVRQDFQIRHREAVDNNT